MDDVASRMVYSYKISISKRALREKYDEFFLKDHIIFQLHGYRYNSYDPIDYSFKLSLRKMTLTIVRKNGEAFSASEWIFFDQVLPEFFEKLEVD